MTPDSSPPQAPPATSLASPAVAVAGSAQRVSSAMPWWASVALALSVGALAWGWWQQGSQRRFESLMVQRVDEAQRQVAEARTLAKVAEEQAREAQAKASVLEQRMGESVAQRSQLETMMLALSKSRDENVLSEAEAALKVAEQLSALTGHHDPVVMALKNIDERLVTMPAARALGVRRAIAADLDRLGKRAGVEPAALAQRLDQLLRDVQTLPLVMPHVATSAEAATQRAAAPQQGSGEGRLATGDADVAVPMPAWRAWLVDRWRESRMAVADELRDLVRVTRIDQPDAALMAPEQALFVRENLRLRLLSARLAVLSRQHALARSDLSEAKRMTASGFDASAPRVVAMVAAIDQLQAAMVEASEPVTQHTGAALQAALAGVGVRRP